MSLVVSAPSKIHLLGEHAVVYGYPALLAAVGKRLYVAIKRKKNEKKIKEEIAEISPVAGNLIQESIGIFKKAYGINKLSSIEISVSSHFPPGSGMGYSAAESAAVIGACMKYIKNIWNPVRINELAYEAEKIAHGNPSGADNSTVVFGGLLWYRKEFDFLKSLWSLPMTQYKIPQFAFIDTGRPEETTKEMVLSVKSLKDKNIKKIRDIFINQEQQTKKLLLALKERNTISLKEAIHKGESNLEKINVVGEFAKKIIRSIESYGGAAKICGAGGKKKGSGIVLCYHHDLSTIKRVAQNYNVPFFRANLGEEGIRIEHNQLIHTNHPINTN